MTGNLNLRCLAFVYVTVVLAGLVILLWPERRVSPLVNRAQWSESNGFFTGNSPNSLETRNDILTSPESVFWRSWSPATLATSGRVTSAAFMAPPFMAIPVGGFPNEEPGMEIYLQKLDTGERLAIVNARMNTQWSQVDIRIPEHFRSSPVCLVAESGSTRKYVSVGTPFKISRASYLKSRMPALLVLHAMGFGYFLLLVFAFHVLAHRFISQRHGFPLGLGCACLLGFAAFFVFYGSPSAGRYFSAVLFFGSFMVVALPRLRTARAACIDSGKDYYAIWFLVSLFYVLVLYMVDTGAGSWHANSRFMPVRWSSDNQLPILTAEQLFQGKSLKNLLSPFLVSDRPPLLAGLMTLARVPFEALIKLGLSNSIIQYYLHIFGIVANSLWAPALAFGLRRLGVRDARSLACTLVAVFLPFTIFNSVYVWPKLLAGSLALLAFLVLLDGFNHRPQAASDMSSPFYVVALLAALALMTHGGTVFGLLVIALCPLAWRYLPVPRHILGVLVVAIAVISPWLEWQRRVDPPGNAVTKDAFTGSPHFDEPNVTVLQTIRRTYGELTFPAWLTMKKERFALLLGASEKIEPKRLANILLPQGGNMHKLPHRVRGFFFLIPSLGLLPLALAAFAATRKNWKEMKRFAPILPTGFCTLVTVGLLSLVVTVLAMWGSPIVHHLPYQAELAIILALLLLLTSSARPWAVLTGFLIVGHGLLIWIIGPAFSALRYDQVAILLLTLWGLYTVIWVREAFRDDIAAPSDTR